MPTIHVELNNRTRKDGQAGIMLRVTHDRRHKRIALGRYIEPKYFKKGAKRGRWIKTSAHNHKSLNEFIVKRVIDFENKFNNAENDEVAFSSLRKAEVKDFFDYAEKHIDRARTSSKYRTAQKREHILNKLRLFVGPGKFPFSRLTTSFIKDYEAHLRGRGNKVNTIHTDLKNIKTIIKGAIVEGYIPESSNPFSSIRLKTEKTTRERLDREEIQKIVQADLSEFPHLVDVRNYFMFSFYCAGIRFGDFAQLKWRNIVDGRLTYEMDKTGAIKSIPLVGDAKEILKKYKMEKAEHFIFPLLNNDLDYSDIGLLKRQISSKNAIVNKHLKTLGTVAKVGKKISFHISRHSFADIARKKTGLDGISKALGHSSIAVTQKYLAGFDQDSIDKAINDVFGE